MSACDEYLKNALKSFKNDLKLDIFQYGFDNVIEDRKRKEICPFIKKYSNFDDEFGDIIPENHDKWEYTQIIWEIFSFELQYKSTGIVLAGFNLKSHYPSFFEIELYFNDDGKIIYEILDHAIDSKEPIIKVFAINEEAYTFITGVNEDFIEFMLKYISDANDSIVENVRLDLEEEDVENPDKILEILKKAQNKEYSQISKHIRNFRLNTLEYTTYSIENLPEWLICLFADLLIRLTAVKQKTSSEIESVSIDSDILIMRKNVGLKWIKNYEEIL
jgi:hypothetical protein